MALSVEDGAAFVALMKRYVVDYTNRHDQAQTEFIMEPDYVLRMGEHVVGGRDGAYWSATAKQLTQFPGLGLTVHEIATSGERLVMRFSEHGASRYHEGRLCAWSGIGLYAWNGERLTRNFVEQDYFARKRQLASGVPGVIESPSIAPWDTKAQGPDAEAEAVVLAWLKGGDMAKTPGVMFDDQRPCEPALRLVDQTSLVVNDLFSCGPNVAFHVTQHGGLAPGGGIKGVAGTLVALHMAGLVRIEDGRVGGGRVIRNRLNLARRMASF
jgi:hypothetical protein